MACGVEGAAEFCMQEYRKANGGKRKVDRRLIAYLSIKVLLSIAQGKYWYNNNLG